MTGSMRGVYSIWHRTHLFTHIRVLFSAAGRSESPPKTPVFAIGRAISHPSVSPSGESRGLRRIYQVSLKLNSIRSGFGRLLPSSQLEIEFSAGMCKVPEATSQPPC